MHFIPLRFRRTSSLKEEAETLKARHAQLNQVLAHLPSEEIGRKRAEEKTREIGEVAAHLADIHFELRWRGELSGWWITRLLKQWIRPRWEKDDPDFPKFN